MFLHASAMSSRESQGMTCSAMPLRTLHRRMFSKVWKWAGSYRTTPRNLGWDAHRIPEGVRVALDDAFYWLANRTYPAPEAVIRLHHRLVVIRSLVQRKRSACAIAGRHPAAREWRALIVVGRRTRKIAQVSATFDNAISTLFGKQTRTTSVPSWNSADELGRQRRSAGAPCPLSTPASLRPRPTGRPPCAARPPGAPLQRRTCAGPCSFQCSTNARAPQEKR